MGLVFKDIKFPNLWQCFWKSK